ncbi:DUF29 domain-containing protein [Aromatoleum petrolei]|uniref:DUF29 family protein n=1 Tax=Aromatoleum petrolei TaxID=76116 RepID=A0ABX1MGR5_9RHOO|nr:DUF29 domain-containing protein [Aromatoleum petrolei]NMF87142.1 DUF29 family protein [Aromatoleum petrolei]QTQ34880.1 putative protein DUF29 [Aromatoleum petrolei]
MSAYDDDFAAWAAEQAQMLRNGQLAQLDTGHIAEELESLARRERRALATCMSGLLAQLLAGQYQPERQTAVWHATIRAERREIRQLLEESPSLTENLSAPRWRDMVWSSAFAEVVEETGLDGLPATCPWSLVEEVLAEEWLPS